MTRINQVSQDLTNQNIEQLKQLIPEAFISGKINIDTFKISKAVMYNVVNKGRIKSKKIKN